MLILFQTFRKFFVVSHLLKRAFESLTFSISKSAVLFRKKLQTNNSGQDHSDEKYPDQVLGFVE